MYTFALILLTIFALVVLAGFILSLAAGMRPRPHLPFPTPPENDYFDLTRILTMTDTLWHPGRGDLTDPMRIAPSPEFPNHPME
ncbi:MAG: hypothetical protein ABSA01_13530 [Anaerolineales bacterium]|jgi:hypothetical protein